MNRVNFALGAVAAVLGGAAGAVSLAGRPTTGLDAPLPALAEAHRVSAVEVAGWLRGRRPDLTILDVRADSAAFAAFHLPRARHLPLASLRDLPAATPGTVVVYADGGDLAARAWLVLRALGHDSVRVMPDGVGDWLSAILNPTIPSDASPEARAVFATQADLARYFGGLPRVVSPGEAAVDTSRAAVMGRMVRRGCAF